MSTFLTASINVLDSNGVAGPGRRVLPMSAKS